MPKIRLSELMAENWGKSVEEIQAIINAPGFDYEIEDDREAVPVSALTPEEREIAKKLLFGEPLTKAEEKRLNDAFDRDREGRWLPRG